MLPARSERGFLSFSAIIALLVMASLIFLAIKLLPPYITNYQFQDSLDNLSRTATYSPIAEGEIRKAVMKQAGELGIQLQENQLAVRKSGGSVDIAVRYVVPVNLLVRQVELTFEPAAGNRNILSK